MRLTTPRLVVAGLAGDSGKTLVSLGITRALRARGLEVAPFKKGPDYIDAAWLAAAAGRPGRNLDTFLQEASGLGKALSTGCSGADVAVIEGNRGLFDGVDAEGTHSTAGLARRLGAPVVLVVDVKKATRTVAALVLGCRAMDPDLNLAGVILNRVATPRQERVIRRALESVGAPPVLGALPRIEGSDPLPGRHLGLITAAEHPSARQAIDAVGHLARRHIDLDRLLSVATTATPVELPGRKALQPGPPVRIGVVRDEAFSFYYPENLEALEEIGAELVFFSALANQALPDVDGLYIGGGFPELYAARLSGNRALGADLRRAVERGLPVYAECGGLMYLARELITGGVSYPMTGVLDLVVRQTPRPCGHGYVEGVVERTNPFFEIGTRLRGHEFHYSHAEGGRDRTRTVVTLERGPGLAGHRDGIVAGRVWASYLHLHALGTPAWAEGLMGLARAHQGEEVRSSAVCC